MKFSNTVAVCLLAGLLSHAEAAPAQKKTTATIKRIQWEYAVLKPTAYRKTNSEPLHYTVGAEVYFTGKEPVFIGKNKFESDEAFLVKILDRLGAQGWEAINVPVHRSSTSYVLKRRK